MGADRLRTHLHDILDTSVRHILVDATDVDRCDPLVVELLGRTQEQLSARRGLLTVIGLAPQPAPPGRDPRTTTTPAQATTLPRRPAPATATDSAALLAESRRATATAPVVP